MNSALRQTLIDFEHLICSDGTPENLARQIVSQYDHRFRYLHTPQPDHNYGNGVRRFLLSQAKGQFCTFLDADNFIFPTYLEKTVLALGKNPQADFAICEILHYGPLPPIHGDPPVVLPGEILPGHIDTLQVLCRTAAIKDIGWLGYAYGADAVTYTELAKKYAYVRVPECLCVHS